MPSRNRLPLRSSEPPDRQRAWQYALRLLTARDYSAARLRGKLRDKGFSDDDAEEVVARIVSEGWVNDRRFAERFVESARASGRYFGYRLRQELQRRGVPSDVADDVLGGYGGDVDSEILAVCERRFGNFSFDAADDREKRRVVGYLQRRGFGLSAILRVLRQRR